MRKAYVPYKMRRSYNRFRADAAANLIVDEQLNKPLVIKDLSCRGACVVAEYQFSLKQRVRLEMVIPFFAGIVRRDASVVWVKRLNKRLWQAGLDFGCNNMLTLS